MLEKLIKTLCALPAETEWVEFKENKDQPELIGQYLSGLSNAACLHNQQFGYLVFGIQNETHKVVGTRFDPFKTKGKGNENIEPWLARLLSPRVDFNVFSLSVKGKRVIIFRVDATQNTPVRFQGRAYIRVGSYLKPLEKYPEKERKIWQKTAELQFEDGITLSEQSSEDVLNKIDYPAFFELLGMTLPDNRQGILDKLLQEEVIIKDNAEYMVSNLGGLLFAKRLNSFPSLKRRAVRVTTYDGDDRLRAIKEQVGMRGYAVGFEGLIDYIDDQLPTNEIIKDALRITNKMYPKVAVREFVANALIHQDLSITGSAPTIEIFKTRIEVTNPGQPLIDPDRFIDHAPRSRNEKLASLMRRMNICEERGSGIDRAITEIEVYQLPAPIFEADEQFVRVTLFAHRSLRQMDRKDKIRACYQHCCLRWVCRDPMTNSSLRKRLGIDQKNYPMASRIISDTLKEEFVKIADPVEKSPRNRKYIPFWA